MPSRKSSFENCGREITQGLQTSNLRGQLAGREFDDDEKVSLETKEHEILRAVIAAALVVDPVKWAHARKISQIMHEGWGAVMEPGRLSSPFDTVPNRASYRLL